MQVEVREQVLAALAALQARVSARSYQVFCLRLLDGLREKEVAAQLGLTLNQVRDGLRSAKPVLRAIYEQYKGRP